MNITISLNGTDPKEAFRAGAFWKEYKQHCSTCGCCGGTDIIPVLRVAVAKSGKNAGKSYEMYEATCMNPQCRATFSFGQKQDEAKTLYPGKMNQATNKVERVWRKYDAGSGHTSFTESSDDDSDSIPF